VAEPAGAKVQLVEIATPDAGRWEACLTALGMFKGFRGSGVGGTIFQQGSARVLVAGPPGAAGQAPAAAGPRAARRDGVTDVYLAVPDLTRAWTDATEAGAAPLSPPRPVFTADFTGMVEDAAVAGIGIGHTLVSWPASMVTQVPPAPDDVSIDYLVLAVDDVGAAARFYGRAFGMELLGARTLPAGAGQIRTVVLGGTGWALAVVAQEPPGSPGPVSHFLAATGGPGIAHIALRVPDILSAVGQAAARGIDFLPIAAAHYDAARARLGYVEPNLAELQQRHIAIGRDEAGRITYQAATGPVTSASQVSLGLVQRPAGPLELSQDVSVALAAAWTDAGALAAAGPRS